MPGNSIYVYKYIVILFYKETSYNLQVGFDISFLRCIGNLCGPGCGGNLWTKQWSCCQPCITVSAVGSTTRWSYFAGSDAGSMCWGRWLQRWCCQGSGGHRCTISQPGYGSEIEDGIRRSQWVSLVWGRSLPICFTSSWQVVETSGWLWCLTIAGSEICWEQPPRSAFWLASTWAPKAVSQVWFDHLHDGNLGQLSSFLFFVSTFLQPIT